MTLLADERVVWTDTNADGADDSAADNETLWALTDHLGTVRDLASDAGVVLNHKQYDAFGAVTAESQAAKDVVFGYTGRLRDDAAGLQNNLHRWYDASVGSWLSEDPIGFGGGDANLYRYVGNGATGGTDPSGLVPQNVGWGWPSSNDYLHYLFNPGEQDDDIQNAQVGALCVAGVAAGGAGGLYAAGFPAFGGSIGGAAGAAGGGAAAAGGVAGGDGGALAGPAITCGVARACRIRDFANGIREAIRNGAIK